ncbi:hypothetical protein Vretifemale_18887 [Volvox reticuliferus]|uniref:Uncharacterized protein n=1 Tax=Volvox reticuliferus TaxID=1737510 RepID=A0A8J4G032_9CHLO|nr:hypothetical protein Vretifemale_18887 [Volvox reticuliferus]
MTYIQLLFCLFVRWQLVRFLAPPDSGDSMMRRCSEGVVNVWRSAKAAACRGNGANALIVKLMHSRGYTLLTSSTLGAVAAVLREQLTVDGGWELSSEVVELDDEYL